RHPDDIGHSNLRAQPPVPGIGHPVESAQKTLLPLRHQLTGTDERRSAAQQQFSSARPNPLFTQSLQKWMPG
ncbi:hypothetical protein JYY06_004640, partial [Salmonella enterica subsp. enterica serovar Newport]|nr:hypothetical protein [Salmonella enterica subsp. enterica serovar Newport]